MYALPRFGSSSSSFCCSSFIFIFSFLRSRMPTLTVWQWQCMLLLFNELVWTVPLPSPLPSSVLHFSILRTLFVWWCYFVHCAPLSFPTISSSWIARNNDNSQNIHKYEIHCAVSSLVCRVPNHLCITCARVHACRVQREMKTKNWFQRKSRQNATLNESGEWLAHAENKFLSVVGCRITFYLYYIYHHCHPSGGGGERRIRCEVCVLVLVVLKWMRCLCRRNSQLFWSLHTRDARFVVGVSNENEKISKLKEHFSRRPRATKTKQKKMHFPEVNEWISSTICSSFYRHVCVEHGEVQYLRTSIVNLNCFNSFSPESNLRAIFAWHYDAYRNCMCMWLCSNVQRHRKRIYRTIHYFVIEFVVLHKFGR